MHILVLADAKTALAFRLAGLETRIIRHDKDIIPVVKDSLKREDIGILLLTDEIAQKAEKFLDRPRHENLLPLVVRIPSCQTPKTTRMGAKERLAALLRR